MIHEGGSVDKFCQKKIKIKILLSGQTWQQDKQLWFWISCQKTPLCVFATLRSLHPIAWGVKLLDHSFILPNLCFMIVSTQMFPLQLLNSPPLFLSSTPFTPLCFYPFILELHPVPKPQLFYNLDFKHFTISHHNSLFFFFFAFPSVWCSDSNNPSAFITWPETRWSNKFHCHSYPTCHHFPLNSA